MGKKRAGETEALLSLRATVLFLLGALTGLAGGLLLEAAGRSLPESVMGAFIAAGSSLTLFRGVVGD